MNTNIITEYLAQFALWRKGKRISIGKLSSRRDEEDYLQRLRDHIGYVTFERGSGTYKVLNIPGRVLATSDKLVKASKPQKNYGQQFAAELRDQTRTYATPAERARIMADLTATGDYQEYATEPDYPIITDIKHTMFYIPSFTNSERIAA